MVQLFGNRIGGFYTLWAMLLSASWQFQYVAEGRENLPPFLTHWSEQVGPRLGQEGAKSSFFCTPSGLSAGPRHLSQVDLFLNSGLWLYCKGSAPGSLWSPRKYLAMPGCICDCQVLLGRCQPTMHTTACSPLPPTTKNQLAPNVSHAEIDKYWC